MLNTTEINFFKEALEERKVKIETNLNTTSGEMNAMRHNELKDEGDHAAMSLETAVDNAILGQQSKELAEIELALDRINDKTYGECDMCGDDINIERLKVKTFARYCITCREVIEKE
ncbi:MAG: C4-type zinc finger protein, DksA/TraR family [uncultured Sulfurovum sp.]|uniref:C4-type zinc finger protein, DksA/TraR family n=1 Tax=uncultured Sulfurovum sp. TaxID=269237 RepID=A0A6S6U3T0_9BACT|nr:MAG: C4-type zinc finger protein, DksA/TraR family [uncultured Sulfurovum sp.]